MRSVLLGIGVLVGAFLLAAQTYNTNTGRSYGANGATLSGTTGSIGGGALLAGACASGTATVTGATVGMPAMAAPSDGTNIIALGTSIGATVTSANTVTVNVCALVALTPTSKQYAVRVVP
jgi:hypothetical protein